MTCAQLGLRPGVLGQAWGLPFKNWRTGQYEAHLIVGYQGLVELAMRTGTIASVIARTVYEGDVFDVSYGVDDTIVLFFSRRRRTRPASSNCPSGCPSPRISPAPSTTTKPSANDDLAVAGAGE